MFAGTFDASFAAELAHMGEGPAANVHTRPGADLATGQERETHDARTLSDADMAAKYQWEVQAA